MDGKLFANINNAAIQILLGATNGTVPVNIPSDFFTNVSIGGGFCPLRQNARFIQRINPHLPVFTTHHRYGVINFFLASRCNGNVFEHTLIGIHRPLHHVLTNGLQCGHMNVTGFWMLATGRRQTVNH